MLNNYPIVTLLILDPLLQKEVQEEESQICKDEMPNHSEDGSVKAQDKSSGGYFIEIV